MQDQFVLQAQFAGIEYRLPGPQHLEVLTDAPEFVPARRPAILAGQSGRVWIAVEPSLRLSDCHGRSFLHRWLKPAAVDGSNEAPRSANRTKESTTSAAEKFRPGRCDWSGCNRCNVCRNLLLKRNLLMHKSSTAPIAHRCYSWLP